MRQYAPHDSRFPAPRWPGTVVMLMIVLGAALSSGQDNENEWEYLVSPDAKRRWKIEQIFSWIPRATRVSTVPPLNPDMSYKRAVVLKKGIVVGFVRVMAPYPSGATIGPLADSMDITKLRHGDVICDYTVERVRRRPLASLSDADRKRITEAIQALGAELYARREDATEYLKQQPRVIIPLLAEAVEHPDPEVRVRATKIRDTIQSREFVVSAEMVQILERESGRAKPVEKQGFLGIGIADFDDRGTRGALVTQVIPNSPAATAGLKLRDVITAIGKEKLYDSADLLEIISAKDPGTAVPITVFRGAKSFTTKVTLTHRPAPLP